MFISPRLQMSVRVVLYLLQQKEHQPVVQIARDLDFGTSFVYNCICELVKAKICVNYAGSQGGSSVIKHDVTLYDVAKAVEPVKPIFGLVCQDFQQAMERTARRIRLREYVDDTEASKEFAQEKRSKADQA